MAANKRCLVIDDSDVVRRVAKQILTSMDFEVSEAENGEQALDACRAAMPDAIIVDWQMPVISGLEFISLLRNQPDGEKPVIVYCTTENDPQDIARALSAGADDYMMKPFDRKMLRAKLVDRAANV